MTVFSVNSCINGAVITECHCLFPASCLHGRWKTESQKVFSVARHRCLLMIEIKIIVLRLLFAFSVSLFCSIFLRYCVPINLASSSLLRHWRFFLGKRVAAQKTRLAAAELQLLIWRRSFKYSVKMMNLAL